MSSNFMSALAGTHLYPITDRHLSGLSHAKQVALLSEAGGRLVQLREKVDAPAKFYAEAEVALRIARELGTKVVINDRVDIALALRADGVHLGQDDLSPEAARRILGPTAIIGFSTHNLEQARLGIKMSVDYIAIGPIFATTTKKSSNPPVGLEGLKLVCQAVGDVPVIAIGGVTVENIRLVLETGASAVAVISDIWKPPGEAPTKTRRLLSSS
jgi:thiamine-phosphate pyrophosphorylase